MSKKNKKKENTILPKIKPIFEKRFKEMLKTEEEYKKFIDCILEPQRKSFRINEIKCEDVKKTISNLKKKISIEKISWLENAFFLNYEKSERTDLGNLEEHFFGEIYIQEITSMLSVECLDIPKNIKQDFKVLDMCAAPGSKTTQIGMLMKNKGILIANEIDYKRIAPLNSNLQRCGIYNNIITNLDASLFKGENEFDRILADVPCSGSGIIRKSPLTLKVYNPKLLKSFRRKQLRILKRGFELLKPGGILVYSTCSLDPEENELNIQEFLQETPNAKLLKINIKDIKLDCKIFEFNDVKIHKNIINNTIRIWPHHNNTNGFFIAKIKKIK